MAELTEEEYLKQLTDEYLTDEIIDNESLMKSLIAVIKDWELDKIGLRPGPKDSCERNIGRVIFNELIDMRDAEVDW